MAKWGQNERLDDLARRVGWKGGDLVGFADVIQRMVQRLPGRIAHAVDAYYLRNASVDRRERDGKYDSKEYQKLYIGRDCLMAIFSLTEEDLQAFLDMKKAGLW